MKKECKIEREFAEYFSLKYPATAKKTSWHFFNFLSAREGFTGDAKRDNTLKLHYRFKEWCVRNGHTQSWRSAVMWQMMGGGRNGK